MSTTTKTPRTIVATLSDKSNGLSGTAKAVLTRLTIKGSYSWSGLGYVPKGESARKVTYGPLVEGPWAYGFPLCHVIDNHGGTGAEMDQLRKQGLLFEVEGGERIEIDGVLYTVRIERRGRDAWVHLDNVEA